MASSRNSTAPVNPDSEEDSLVEDTNSAYSTVAMPVRESAKITLSDPPPRCKSDIKRNFSSQTSKYHTDASNDRFYHLGSPPRLSRCHSLALPDFKAAQPVPASDTSRKDVPSMKREFQLAAPSTTLKDLSRGAKPPGILWPLTSPSVFGRESSTLFSPVNIIFAPFLEDNELNYQDEGVNELDPRRETSEDVELKLVTLESQRMEVEKQNRKSQEEREIILSQFNKLLQDAITPLCNDLDAIQRKTTALKDNTKTLQRSIIDLKEAYGETRRGTNQLQRRCDVLKAAIEINGVMADLALATLYPSPTRNISMASRLDT